MAINIDKILTGATSWLDYTNSDPVGDVEEGVKLLKIKMSKLTIDLSYDVYWTLVWHPGVVMSPYLKTILEFKSNIIEGQNKFILWDGDNPMSTYAIKPLDYEER